MSTQGRKPDQTEIVVTPEMIQAGVSAYADWDSTDDWSLGRLVESLYRAMREKAPQSDRTA